MEVALIATTQNDVNQLLAMIHALAQNEGIKQISLREKDLIENLYSNEPVAYAKFITFRGEVAGFIIHSWKFATFLGTREMYMQAIYILPIFRRMGIAKNAIGLLAKMALEAGCSRLEWLIVKGNKESNEFYDALGANTLEHAVIRRFEKKTLQLLVDQDS